MRTAVRARDVGLSIGLLAIALTASSCESPDITAPGFDIRDAAHDGGNEHFFFLPPMVPPPSYAGVFDPSVAPVVEICEWTGEACTLPLVARFTRTSGPGSETVRLDVASELYVVSWHTDRFRLDVTKTYRIRVSSAGIDLGFADVVLARDGTRLLNLNSSQYVGLVNGRTLPIKFRIETGALSEWQLTGFLTLSGVTALAVNAADALFAAVQGGNAGSTGPGLYRSTDNGASWLALNSGLTNTNVKGVTVTSNGDVYVGTHGGGVWRSVDGGLHWNPTGLTTGMIQIMYSKGASIYALDGFSCTGVYRSRDHGLTWTTLNNGLPTCVNGIAETAGGILFVTTGTSGLFRSTDDGGSWTPANAGIASSDLTRVVVGPSGDVYVGSVGAGIYRSPDNGNSWTAVNNGLPPQALIQGLGIGAGGSLLAGIAGAPGVFRSTDDGAHWLPFNSGLDTPGGIGAVVFENSGYAVVSDGERIWRSTRPLP